MSCLFGLYSWHTGGIRTPPAPFFATSRYEKFYAVAKALLGFDWDVEIIGVEELEQMSFYCYLCSYVSRSFLTSLPAAVAAMQRARDSVCMAVYDCDAPLRVSHPRGCGSRKPRDRRTARIWCSRSQVRCQLTCLAASHALSTDRFLPFRQQAGPLAILIEASRPHPTVPFAVHESL